MILRLCRVTVSDLEGVKHSVEVTASSLYEAVALGLVAIHKEEWTAEIADGLNSVDVTVNSVPVTHSVRMQDFRKWFDRNGGTPKEITQRLVITGRIGGVYAMCRTAPNVRSRIDKSNRNDLLRKYSSASSSLAGSRWYA